MHTHLSLFKFLNFFLLFILIFHIEKSYAVFDEIRKGNPYDIELAISKIPENEINQLFTEIKIQEMIERQASALNNIHLIHPGEFKQVTPLHLACLYGYDFAVKLLLEKKINTQALTTNGWGAINFVVWGKGDHKADLLQLLFQYRSKVYTGVQYDPHFSINKGSSTSAPFSLYVSSTVTKIVDLTNVDEFIQAAKDNSSDLKSFIQENTHLKDEKGSGLYWIIYNSNDEMINFILKDNKIKLLPKHFFASGLIANNQFSEVKSTSIYGLLFNYLKRNNNDLSIEKPNFELYSLISEAQFEKTSNFLATYKPKILPCYYWLAGLLQYKKDFNEAQKFYDLLKEYSEI